MPREAAADQLIAALNLAPLPHEGGFFRATWRSPTASAIFFLLTPEDFSALHRLEQDELWMFHAGDPVEHLRLDPSTGAAHRVRMGPAVLSGDQPQVLVPAGSWQGARLDPAGPGRHGYALFTCTVSPPWEDRGFTLGERDPLLRAFPAEGDLIRRLTR
jgi:predicted cupin superfamily sugar epimerase